jgi:hypothetical protein
MLTAAVPHVPETIATLPVVSESLESTDRTFSEVVPLVSCTIASIFMRPEMVIGSCPTISI